jgi:putative nucleotidyltransferase with HDIG domain
MPDEIRILFVDDEPKILDGLRRMLRSMRSRWSMAFAAGGQEALEALRAEQYDVIVSDIRMPQISGVELLEEVRSSWPQTVRFVLSGQASRESVLRAVGPTHQYLPKPCNAETIKAAITRIGEQRSLLDSPQLRRHVAGLEAVPSLPGVLEELKAELNRPGVSAKSVSSIIARDVGLSAKVLQLVSSGFFGPPRPAIMPAEAANALGVDIIRPLTISLEAFRAFDPADAEAFRIAAVWNHSLRVSRRCRQIAETLGLDANMRTQAALAGLLHDLGKAIFAAEMPAMYRQVTEEISSGADPLESERAHIGATHPQAGAYLAGLWGLDEEVIDAIAHHHRPQESRREIRINALTCLHLANRLPSADSSDSPESQAGEIDTDYLHAAGVDRERLETLCSEPARLA